MKEISLEDRIFLLESALNQAIWSTMFLHGCLTNPSGYAYLYPEQTLKHIEEW